MDDAEGLPPALGTPDPGAPPLFFPPPLAATSIYQNAVGLPRTRYKIRRR
jgi:hypothetical protein